MNVKELYGEATGLLSRWPGGNLPNHGPLDNARNAADAKGIANLGVSDPETIALRQEVEQAWLWECAVNRSGPRKMTYACVAVSLLIMFVVGSLYVFYNQGAALLAEMQTLSAKQPDRRFGQLERQLLVARSDLFEAAEGAADCPEGTHPCPQSTENAIDELAQEASYALLHELRDLNLSLSSLEARKNDFQKLATSPVPGLGRLWNWASDLWHRAISSEAEAAGDSGQGAAGAVISGPNDKLSTTFTTNHFCARQDSGPGSSAQAVEFDRYPIVLGMDMKEIVRQACDYSLRYTSMTVPSVNLWALQVKGIIAPYAAWILPALFACLGAMIYFLRLLVDPTQPSPRVNRLVHRMALAALAGVIAGWFWEPAFGSNSEFQAAGLGLFTFAFVIGFSIEIFFSLLDRFVELSSSAISRLGN
ncbi:hypothetical protein ABUE31_01020 [Mesorhizobium sp. ZMM04-5]|uniref:Transmembrane protein n=2 Tax=Mesorhizobium marinum TaxID=3228790 RepID=A0ABV3QU43_9HYPH